MCATGKACAGGTLLQNSAYAEVALQRGDSPLAPSWDREGSLVLHSSGGALGPLHIMPGHRDHSGISWMPSRGEVDKREGECMKPVPQFPSPGSGNPSYPCLFQGLA